MRNLRKKLMLGCAALGLASVALVAGAQEHKGWECKDKATRTECMQANMAKMRAKQQQKLHALLKITAEQEPAWKTFTESSDAAGYPDFHAFDRKEKLSAPERLQRRLDELKKQETRLSAHLAALTPFYAQLTEEQKKKLDAHRGNQWHHHWDHWHHGDAGMNMNMMHTILSN